MKGEVMQILSVLLF